MWNWSRQSNVILRSDALNCEVSEREKNHELKNDTAIKILSESINSFIETETVFYKIRGTKVLLLVQTFNLLCLEGNSNFTKITFKKLLRKLLTFVWKLHIYQIKILIGRRPIENYVNDINDTTIGARTLSQRAAFSTASLTCPSSMTLSVRTFPWEMA